MQKQELFMVHTVKHVDGSIAYQNTVANSRPEAIRQAERIGKPHTRHYTQIRSFLEGDDLPHHKSLLIQAQQNFATIYKID